MAETSNHAEAERGFWFGVTVAKHVYGIGNDTEPADPDGVLGVLLAVARGDLTLMESPHETVSRMPHLTETVPDAAARLQAMTAGAREAERELAKQIVATAFGKLGMQPPD